ncbi:M48 family metalloprotease [Micromonospora sp. WMMD710]|uniref:M48 family metalloprotease n=1 Tax=Micromonospora sp. WMMD710 TaxID=3016085 RepID=UPI0024175460|nr:M48 family metalloprotease [Micromonospora sp. WMMD710]MDG4757471.1 M48 family metalloprotease [Micromonospora sp. WMMD710]
MSVVLDRTTPTEPSSAHLSMSNAGTLPRFLLLIVLFVGVAAVITGSVINARSDPNGVGVGCTLASGGDPGLSDLDVRVRAVDQASAFKECVERFVPHQAWWWKPGALLLVSLCAVALYWVLPLWKGRRSRVVPVEDVDGLADLSTVLADLVAVAGLRRPPRFVIAPAVPSTGAVVFGRLGRYTVCLDGGLVARRHRDPEDFRSVVLHELAHLHNRDVDIAYATVALWRILLGVILPLDLGYVAVVSLPGTAGTYMQSREQTRVAHHVAMLVITVVLAYLARVDILRTREHHADLTARRWGANVRLWERAAAQEVTGRTAVATRWSRASGGPLWRAHPTWQQRLGSMVNSGTMLTPQVLSFFLTGATAAIAATRLPALLSMVEVNASQEHVIIAVLVAVLVTAITGLLLWPAVTHAARTGGPAPSGLRAGGALGAGLIVGELAVGRSGSVWDLLPDQPGYLALPVLAGLAATWWTAEYAQVSATRPAGAAQRWPLLVGLGVSCCVMALAWYWWESEGTLLAGGLNAFTADLFAQFERSVTDGQGYEGTLLHLAPGLPPLLFLSMRVELLCLAGLLCVTAILAWFPRRVSTGAPWPTLPAAGIGAFGSTVLVVATTAGIRAWSPVVAGGEQGHLVSYLTWLMVVIVAAMFVAAGFAAALADRTPLLQSLIVSGATGLAGLATLAVLASVDGCVRPLEILGSSCRFDPVAGWTVTALLVSTTLGLGVFLAVAAAALGVPARPPLRRFRDRAMATRRPRTDLPDRPGRGRLALRRAAVLMPCLVTATLVTVMAVDARSDSSTDAGPVSTNFVLTDQPTSPTVRAAQVDAWLALGGADRINQVLTGVLALLERIDRLTADGSYRAFSDWSVIDAELRPRCVAISGPVADARRYFDYPEPREQAAWDALLAGAERAAGDCDLAIRHRDREGYLAALRELLQFGRALPAVTGDMIR